MKGVSHEAGHWRREGRRGSPGAGARHPRGGAGPARSPCVRRVLTLHLTQAVSNAFSGARFCHMQPSYLV